MRLSEEKIKQPILNPELEIRQRTVRYFSTTGPFSNRTIHVKVTGLGDPDDEHMIDDTYGILCEARHQRRMVTLPLGELEVRRGRPNRQLIADYCYWFWNNR